MTQGAGADSKAGGTGHPFWILLPYGLLVVAALFPYRHVLELGFTGIDAIPSVAAARTASWAELPELLTVELRGQVGGSTFYYRPLTSMTYALDYALWGWNAAGYHLTDLLLHALAVCAVFAMARGAFERSRVEAFVVALLFLLHPATNEVVPAVARRQEPILVIAFCLALLGARRLPARGGWALAVAGSCMAVTAVERGLVLPAVFAAYLVFYRLRILPLGEGLKLTARWSAAPLGVSLAFYGVRSLLTTGSGIHFAPGKFLRTYLEFAEWVLYPQQILDLAWPDSWLGSAALAATALLLGGVLAVALLRPERRGLHLVALSWLLASCTLIAIAGQMNSWCPYAAAPALALIVTSLIFQAGVELRARGFGVVPAAGLLAIAFAAVAIVAASPVLREYEAWSRAGRLGLLANASALDVAQRVDPDSGIVLLNTPSHVRETGGDFLVTRSAAVHWPYSLMRWLELQGVERPVLALGSSRHRGAMKTPCVALVGTDRLRVYFPDESSAYDNVSTVRRPARPVPRSLGSGLEFEWPPAEFEDRPIALFLFDGERFRQIAVGPRANA